MGRIVFVGHFGSDAGGWYIGADGKLHRIPGWDPEQLVDLQHAVSALRSIAQLKHPAVAERVAGALHELITKELGANIKEGDVVVVG